MLFTYRSSSPLPGIDQGDNIDDGDEGDPQGHGGGGGGCGVGRDVLRGCEGEDAGAGGGDVEAAAGAPGGVATRGLAPLSLHHTRV